MSAIIAVLCAPKRYHGYSAEAKPASSATAYVPPGAVFYELDTGKVFVWDGLAAVWRELDSSEIGISLTMANTLAEIQIMQQMLADEVRLLRLELHPTSMEG